MYGKERSLVFRDEVETETRHSGITDLWQGDGNNYSISLSLLIPVLTFAHMPVGLCVCVCVFEVYLNHRIDTRSHEYVLSHYEHLE